MKKIINCLVTTFFILLFFTSAYCIENNIGNNPELIEKNAIIVHKDFNEKRTIINGEWFGCVLTTSVEIVEQLNEKKNNSQQDKIHYEKVKKNFLTQRGSILLHEGDTVFINKSTLMGKLIKIRPYGVNEIYWIPIKAIKL